MKTFIALYRGATVSNAKLVAVSADPLLVSQVAGQILQSQVATEDPALQKLEKGRKSALREIQREAHAESPTAEILKLIQGEAEEQE